MKELIGFYLLLVTLSACNRTTQNAGNSSSAEDIAEMKFDEIYHDFGTLQEGEIVKHSFKFKNTGKTPLLIKDVQVGCGCTVASKPEAPVEAGTNSQIVVQFNSKGKAGVNRKYVTITSNAIPEQTVLTFTAIVEGKALK